MKLLLKISKFFGVLFLTVFLTLTVLAFSLHQITSPQQISELIEQIAKIYISKQNLTQFQREFNYLKEYCKIKDKITFQIDDKNLTIECEELENKDINQFSVYLSEKIVKERINEIYYKNYTCKFEDCWKERENIFYYFSHQANVYYFTLTLYFMFTSFLGLFLILIAERAKSVKTIANCLIFVGITYFFKFFIGKMIEMKVPQDFSYLTEIIVKTISPIFDNFLPFLLTGIALFAIYKLRKLWFSSNK